jgi:hypothetical protein
MTDIPGTGKLKSLTENTQDVPLTPISVVNIKELKRGDSEPIEYSINRYDKFYFWLIAGSVISLIFLLVSLKYRAFWIFVPVGPIAAIISWYVRKIVKKYEPKPKKYSA